MRRRRLAIIGCGSIGTSVAGFLDRKLAEKIEVTSVFDVEPGQVAKIIKTLHHSKPSAAKSIEAAVKRADLVLETAAGEVVGAVVQAAAAAGKDAVVLSIGGFLADPSLISLADKAGINLYLPSGAIAGVDGILAAATGKITSLTLTTSKPPSGLKGTSADEKASDRRTVLFEGSPREAYKKFPRNINVAATLLMASHYPRIKVKIVLDPAIKRNVHRVELESDICRMTVELENIPSRDNPRTSAMAIASTNAFFLKMFSGLKPGV
jgi:aspartate dehydrogenase